MNGPKLWSTLRANVFSATSYRNQPTIAGGCIRDWMLGLQHKDIDIFVPNFTEDMEPDFRGRMERYGFVFVEEANREQYEGAFKVLNYEWTERTGEDHAVQVVLLPGTFTEHFALFDYNMVKAYYDMSGVHLSYQFIDGLERKNIYMTNYTQQDTTRDRMVNFANKVNVVDPGWIVERPLF